MIMFVKFGQIVLFSFLVKLHHGLASNGTRASSNTSLQNIYQSRIVGGMPASAEKYPHNVLIHRLSAKAFCGGSIIAIRWILTAAQCYAPHLVIYVGSDWLLGGERYDVRFSDKNKYIHPKYHLDSVSQMPRYDFMLIKLNQDLVFGQYVKAIQLSWLITDTVARKVGYLPGYGEPVESFKEVDPLRPRVLRETYLPIIEFEKCKEIFSSGGDYLGKKYHYTAQVMKDKDAFCAGYIEGGRSMCTGDVGAGFIVDGILLGIASRSIGCARPRSPNIFAAVPYAREWICNTAGV